MSRAARRCPLWIHRSIILLVICVLYFFVRGARFQSEMWLCLVAAADPLSELCALGRWDFRYLVAVHVGGYSSVSSSTGYGQPAVSRSAWPAV